jgi:hypothetical protein
MNMNCCSHFKIKDSYASSLNLDILKFGPGKIQQHGFARNLDWSIASTSADPNPDEKDPTVELTLSESEYTLKM